MDLADSFARSKLPTQYLERREALFNVVVELVESNIALRAELLMREHFQKEREKSSNDDRDEIREIVQIVYEQVKKDKKWSEKKKPSKPSKRSC